MVFKEKKELKNLLNQLYWGDGGGEFNLEGNHEYWFTNQFIFKNT